MSKREKLTREYFQNRLSYDKDSGTLTWKIRGSDQFCCNTRVAAIWNTKYAGRPAGCLDKDGYISMHVDSSRYYAHHIVWVLETDSWPNGILDHINGVRTDNRWANLREVNRLQHAWNCARRKDNTSGYKGVYRHYGKWMAKITVNGRTLNLGVFSCPKEASIAYESAASIHYGEFYRPASIKPDDTGEGGADGR